MEGVNDQGTNQATLHTSPDCLMPTSRTMAGTPTYDTCDVTLNFNAGCGVKFPTASSFGPAFNTNGGGWFASYCAYISHARSFVNPDAWGTPAAYFPNTFCDFSTHFDPQNIIINLTLCGDWAGSTYSQGTGCPLTCVDHVNYNASAFTDAYFDFASIRKATF
ncbi:glycoside hydrolase family 16 protein [Laccaria bicolor S238N-H82]|uniref:Glycoside hydrolase family 16 protein n=1 Tax=Laccaria bicolor (strain S238N-H82 / ATCC MYA-4686) TaxID=486041 RepID=B0E073_LACBS|nr:glycoside hydrolase family 16 protein [Laccaria bicolor S238N-H82]EDQ99772.1 glycoside hydrolase family 16 protein [Laccaria bicolor S238N-H82]|eukprot:XP_001889608.1 glycoside hydrolase family 16 protein [Laccaria bicolor S238N-H82]